MSNITNIEFEEVESSATSTEVFEDQPVDETWLVPLSFKAPSLFTKEEGLIAKAKQAFAVPTEKLDKLKNYVTEIEILGIEDKENFQKIYSARQIAKKERLAFIAEITKCKKFPQQLLKVLNEIAATVEFRYKEIESIAQQKEDVIEEAKKVKKQQEEKAKREKLQNRINSLLAVEAAMDVSLLENLSDAEFEKHLQEVTEEYQMAVIKKEEEEAALKAQVEELQQRAAALNAKEEELKAKEKELTQKENQLEIKETHLDRKEDKIEQNQHFTASLGLSSSGTSSSPDVIRTLKNEVGILNEALQHIYKAETALNSIKSVPGKTIVGVIIPTLTKISAYLLSKIKYINSSQ